jgi:diguanylate cyclase (GGDEF)-like protein
MTRPVESTHLPLTEQSPKPATDAGGVRRTGTTAISAPSRREFVLVLLVTAALSAAVVAGALGPVWLVAGPATVAVGILLYGSLARRNRLSAIRAHRDSLTGLATRRSFLASLSELESYALIVLDLDGLAQVNKQHGHIEGDRILVEFGQALALLMGGAGIVARTSGDQFAVALPKQTAADAVRAVETLRSAIRVDATQGEPLRFAAGVADAHGRMPHESTLEAAERAVQRAKASLERIAVAEAVSVATEGQVAP